MGLGLGQRLGLKGSAGYAGHGAAPAVFDPYSYTGMNANFGFRADDVNITDTDKIDKVDNTGDGDLSMCASAAGRPAWLADGGNGKPCATFDASDDYFFAASESANNDLVIQRVGGTYF